MGGGLNCGDTSLLRDTYKKGDTYKNEDDVRVTPPKKKENLMAAQTGVLIRTMDFETPSGRARADPIETFIDLRKSKDGTKRNFFKTRIGHYECIENADSALLVDYSPGRRGPRGSRRGPVGAATGGRARDLRPDARGPIENLSSGRPDPKGPNRRARGLGGSRGAM